MTSVCQRCKMRGRCTHCDQRLLHNCVFKRSPLVAKHVNESKLWNSPNMCIFAGSVAHNVVSPSTDVEWMEADISSSASMLARASWLANLPDSNLMMKTMAKLSYVAVFPYLSIIRARIKTLHSQWRLRRSSKGGKFVLPAFTCPKCVGCWQRSELHTTPRSNTARWWRECENSQRKWYARTCLTLAILNVSVSALCRLYIKSLALD